MAPLCTTHSAMQCQTHNVFMQYAGMLETPADRLQEARRRAGYDKPADAMREFGWKSTYYQHEDGVRGFGRRIAERYARAFRVSPEWLMFGSGERDFRPPLVGEVGAGDEVRRIDDHAPGGGLEYVDPPPDAELDVVAVRVTGWSMFPAHWPGDVLYFRERAYDPSRLLRLPCIVETTDGRQYVKTLKRGSGPGLFDLESYNDAPLEDISISWAAPIEFVDTRRRYARA